MLYSFVPSWTIIIISVVLFKMRSKSNMSLEHIPLVCNMLYIPLRKSHEWNKCSIIEKANVWSVQRRSRLRCKGWRWNCTESVYCKGGVSCDIVFGIVRRVKRRRNWKTLKWEFISLISSARVRTACVADRHLNLLNIHTTEQRTTKPSKHTE